VRVVRSDTALSYNAGQEGTVCDEFGEETHPYVLVRFPDVEVYKYVKWTDLQLLRPAQDG